MRQPGVETDLRSLRSFGAKGDGVSFDVRIDGQLSVQVQTDARCAARARLSSPPPRCWESDPRAPLGTAKLAAIGARHGLPGEHRRLRRRRRSHGRRSLNLSCSGCSATSSTSTIVNPSHAWDAVPTVRESRSDRCSCVVISEGAGLVKRGSRRRRVLVRGAAGSSRVDRARESSCDCRVGCRRQVCAARGPRRGVPGCRSSLRPAGRGMVFFGSDQVDAIKGTTTPRAGVMTNNAFAS